MEVYTLDSLLRREQVIDKFESLIWTERFSAVGDFELALNSTAKNRGLLSAGTRLAVNTSYRVMTVETVENKIDDEGKALLTVKGRSLEATLEDRVAKDTMSNLTVEPTWNLTGSAASIARTMFNDICVLGNLNAQDIIPFMMPGTIFPADTIPEIDTILNWKQEPDSLYNAIKNICELYDLGFRLVRNFDTSQLYFNVYAGSDRTTLQTILPPVIFSLDLDNMQNTNEFISMEKTKNIAYVFSNVGFEIVYPDNTVPDLDGFERRILLVKVDVPEDVVDISAFLIQKGKEELSKNRSFIAFDGELNQKSNYRYGIDYNLGDLVEMRDSDGDVSSRRVTEQIFVSDKEGERSYPTLTMNLFINPGSWLAWARDMRVWTDFNETAYWANVE